MISDKDISFFKARSEAVLEICAWLTPIVNRIHKVDFSKTFWTRVLTTYALAAYNQKDYFERSDFRAPLTIQPLNGWRPATRKEIIKDRIVTALRSIGKQYSLQEIPDSIPKNENVALGIRAESFSEELDACPLSFKWMPRITAGDRSRRQTLIAEAEKLPTAFKKNICAHVPKLYVEYFPYLLPAFRRAEALPIKKIFVEHYGTLFDALFAAYLSETKGAEIYQLQTGGFVGETQMSIEPLKRAQYDHLLTYGWRIDTMDIPFYGIRLEEFREHYRASRGNESSSGLLIVLGAPAKSPALESHYSECINQFKESLDRDKFASIKFRPRAQSRRLRSVKYPAGFELLSREEIDTGLVPIHQLCASSRVVVQLTMPSTNFLECIFVDHPVTGLDNYILPTEIIKPYLEFFHEAGILHDTPQALVSFLNDCNIVCWWREVLNDSRYQEFKEVFARSRLQYLKAEETL